METKTIGLTGYQKLAQKNHGLNREGMPGGAGTHADPIRYAHVTLTDPQRKAKLAAQRQKFEQDAKSGKVLCLTDLMISHGM